MAKMLSATRVRTGKVRLSYVHLNEPHVAMEGQEPKFSVTLLIPKTDTETKALLDQAIHAVYEENKASIFKGVAEQYIESPIRDGDGVTPKGKVPYGEEAHGHWVLSVKSKADRKPSVVKVVNGELLPIESPTEVYSGCYASVSVNAYAYNKSGKGITFGLGNVLKLEDGEPLGGGASATSDFEIDPITGEPV